MRFLLIICFFFCFSSIAFGQTLKPDEARAVHVEGTLRAMANVQAIFLTVLLGSGGVSPEALQKALDANREGILPHLKRSTEGKVFPHPEIERRLQEGVDQHFDMLDTVIRQHRRHVREGG